MGAATYSGITLGFGRARPAPGADAEIGMLDISANALAVLILATMLVLTVASPPTPQGEARAEVRPELFYPSPLEIEVVPQSVYWIVTQAGVTPLDLNAIAVELAQGRPVAQTPVAEATLVIDRRNYRDLNDHRMRLDFDWSELAANARTLVTDEDISSFTDEVTEAFEGAGTPPTFIVTPAGTQAFAGVYWTLREGQVPMRWVPFETRTPLIFSRRASNFETRGRQWQ